MFCFNSSSENRDLNSPKVETGKGEPIISSDIHGPPLIRTSHGVPGPPVIRTSYGTGLSLDGNCNEVTGPQI